MVSAFLVFGFDSLSFHFAVHPCFGAPSTLLDWGGGGVPSFFPPFLGICIELKQQQPKLLDYLIIVFRTIFVPSPKEIALCPCPHGFPVKSVF